MATDTAPSPSACGSELGDLTRQLAALQSDASNLFERHGSDEEAYELAEQARLIRDRADRIGTTLNLIGDALQNL